MDQEDMPCWVDSFTEFCGRFDDLFARSKSREQAYKFMRGLLAPLERKTNWQPSSRLHDRTPDRMQRLLYRVLMSMQWRLGIVSSSSSSNALVRKRP
jgi:hypothetical protein